MKKYLNIILYSWVFLNITNAQTIIEDKVIVQDTKNFGDYVFKARDLITLNPGFFKNGSYGELNAYIDETLIFDAEYRSEGEIVIPAQRDLDKNLQVGSSVGNFGVGSSGSANYSMPIMVSPGTAGMQPNLAITYNSQAGNGLLGYGWNLSGLSAISRVRKNYYHDGAKVEIKLDSTDKFALDGQRLINLSGTYGASGTEYAKEMEDFTRITSYGNVDGGPAYFVAETKGGNKIYYGNAESGANANLTSNSSSVVLAWCIYKIEDLNGNYMLFDYTTDPATGEILLESIKYTGNAYAGLTPYNEVKIYYEERTDKSYSYVGSVKLENNKIIRQIKCFSDGALYRKYGLEYYFNNYTYLNEFFEYNSENERYNSLVFGYENINAEDGIVVKELIEPLSKNIFGDFDGDGSNELLILTTDNRANVYNYDVVNEKFSDLPTNTTIIPLNPYRIEVADFNGDGKSDLLLYSSDATDHFRLCLYLSTGNGFTFHSTNPEIYPKTSDIYLNDFNGDGFQDILVVEELTDKCKALFGDASSNIFNNKFEQTISGISDTLQFGDFKGKGTMQLAVKDGLYLKFYEFTNGAFNEFYTPPVSASDDRPFICIDFNGDGITDILRPKTLSDNIYKFYEVLYLSNDKINYKSVSGLSFSSIDYPLGFSILDINADGRMDIIVVCRASFYVYLCNDDGYTKQYLTTSNFKIRNTMVTGPDGLGFMLIDVLADEVALHKFGAEYSPGKLVHVKDGMNREILINYGTNADEDVCRTDSNYLLQGLKGFNQVVSLVKSYSTTSGFETPNITSYKYANPSVHEGGLGFLGFGEIEISNQTTGITLQSSNSLNSFFLPQLKTVNKKIDDQIVSVSVQTLQTTNFGQNRFLNTLTQSVAEDKLTNIKTNSSYTYDAFGNTIQQEVYDDNRTATSITTTSYSAHDTRFPAAADSTRVTNTLLGKPAYTRKTNFSYTGHLLTAVVQDPGTTKQISTINTYNAIGQITRTDIYPSDAASSYSEVSYDKTHRFVLQKTVSGGFTESFTYDQVTGNQLTATNIYGHTTNYEYNNFGKLISTTDPIKGKSSITYEWSDGSLGSDVVKETTSSDVAPDVVNYYDILGRIILTKSIKFEGTPLYTKYVYTADGKTSSVSLPYESAPTQWSTKVYDSFYRLEEETAPGVNNTYSYDGKSTTVTNQINQNQATTTLNGLGQVESVTDPNGTITYTYHASGQVHQTITPNGTITSMYDLQGNLLDKSTLNAGTTAATYNSLGQVVSTTSSKLDVSTYFYDALGRLDYYTNPEGTTNYSYVTSGNGRGQIEQIEGPNGFSIAYTYDSYGRAIATSETIDGETYNIGLSYDSKGRLLNTVYPSGFTLEYGYNASGYLNKVKNGASTIWTQNTTNTFGQPTQFTLGNGLVTTRNYNNLGQVTDIITGTVQDLRYHYNQYNLMDYRYDDKKSLTEAFTYDSKHMQLETYTVSGQPTQTILYGSNGNVESKTDVGSFNYNSPDQPHAVTDVSNANSIIPAQTQNIIFNHFNKATQISENGYELNIEYGTNGLRKKTTLLHNSSEQKEKIFVGGIYEKETLADGSIRELHYIPGPDGITAIYTLTNGANGQMHYIHKDHLGSFNTITNASGVIEEELSFDPWGRRRNASDWTYENMPTTYLFDRGFTGHEHLDAFNLVNMNGRVYDPLLTRFLSPDPLIINSAGVAGYNGYSYVLNNPLHMTDPSGYWAGGFQDISKWLEMDGHGGSSGSSGSGGGGGGSGGGGGLGFTRPSGFIRSWYSESTYTSADRSGQAGYEYSDGVYRDRMTGNVVDQQTAINGTLKVYGGTYESYAIFKYVNSVDGKEVASGYGIVREGIMVSDGTYPTFSNYSSASNYLYGSANSGGGMDRLEGAAAANAIAGYTIYEGTKNFAVQLEKGAERVLGYVPAASKHALRGLKSIPYLGFTIGVGIDYGQLRTDPDFTTFDFKKSVGIGVVSLISLPGGGLLYGVDAFYPGGLPAAYENADRITKKNQEILGPTWNLYGSPGTR
jgi:RHS repeat-associated protein